MITAEYKQTDTFNEKPNFVRGDLVRAHTNGAEHIVMVLHVGSTAFTGICLQSTVKGMELKVDSDWRCDRFVPFFGRVIIQNEK